MKNEKPYILEWISYHKAIGVDRIVIYDHQSTDGSWGLLKRLKQIGFIEYKVQTDVGHWSPQTMAYNHCLRNDGLECDLVAFIDADEFLTPLEDTDLKNHLSSVFSNEDELAALAINWRIFGSSNQQAHNPGLVIERFKQADAEVNRTFKSIVKPAQVNRMHIHFAELASGRYGNEFGGHVEFLPEPGGIPGRISEPSAKFLQINHYMVKSLEEYSVKRTRGNANLSTNHPQKFLRFDDDYFRNFDRNHQENLSALRFFEETREIMEWLERRLESV